MDEVDGEMAEKPVGVVLEFPFLSHAAKEITVIPLAGS